MLHELQAELNSCNHVDILVSFITVSGVRKLLDRLKAITATDGQGRSQASVRVLTTTYTGATDQKALNQLAELPNCEVRVSLDGRRTRLHAKAWLFERDTGFGSAYVGSANFSGAALMGGLEWTVKFTQHGQPDLFSQAKAHFETLWLDTEFQPYDPNNSDHQAALRSALKWKHAQYCAGSREGYSSAEKGERYLEQKTNGWQYQLFVKTQKGALCRARGPAQVLSSQGGKPMSIALGLEAALPERLFEGFSVLRAA